MKYLIYSQLNTEQRRALVRRPASLEQETIAKQVASLEQEFLQGGDIALQELGQRFDHVDLTPQQFAIERPLWREAWQELGNSLKEALQVALHNIAKFHLSELPQRNEPVVETTKGVYCWREFRSIEAVGLYIPGGSAPLFSTMLMLGVPAIIAGCRQIVFCSPPNNLPNSSKCRGPYAPERSVYAAQEMLACMELLCQFGEQWVAQHQASVETPYPMVKPELQYFQVGGAQAIFALAYGTALGSVPAVHKIFGPGNPYVTQAKLRMSRHVAIDMLAGPSEVLVIADEHACPTIVAADLLAQAEHGPHSQVLLLSPCKKLLRMVQAELNQQKALLPRSREIQSTLGNSYLIETQNLSQAIAFSNAYAPEHLILAIEDYQPLLPQIRNAGSVFCGPHACESFGDYASGTNHTLPTSGFARSCSGVNTESFGRWLTFQNVSEQGLRALGPNVELLAAREQLQAHKNAVTLRLQQLSASQ